MKKNKFQKLVEQNIKKNVKELVESLKPELKDCSKNYLIIKYQNVDYDFVYQSNCQLKRYLPNKKIIFIPAEFEINSWGNKEFSEYIENLIKARKGE
jgi:hypothetical protein